MDDDNAVAPTVVPLTISGHVINASGQPAGHAVVELFRPASLPMATEVTADADGLFEALVPIKRENLVSVRVGAGCRPELVRNRTARVGS
jgi:hypothetical protein